MSHLNLGKNALHNNQLNNNKDNKKKKTKHTHLVNRILRKREKKTTFCVEKKMLFFLLRVNSNKLNQFSFSYKQKVKSSTKLLTSFFLEFYYDRFNICLTLAFFLSLSLYPYLHFLFLSIINF
jgi:hypothetical protein